MKKTIIAAVAALFIGFGANAQSVNDNTLRVLMTIRLPLPT